MNLDQNIYKKYIKFALFLSIITIFYNIVEGLVSVYFGAKDETLALLGFGADSFVEVLSGIGILHMIIRMMNTNIDKRDKFEKTALRTTGTGFYILTIGLVTGAIINLVNDNKPETTLVGIIVSLISIITMYLLVKFKLKVGVALKSDAIIADANCTKTCFYLSIILLISSLTYEIFKVSYLDIAGTLGIAFFAFREGKESFEKANSDNLSCACEDD
jgi:divalent metal cation (Fe/Co/Zn/Cd) transporter